MIKYLSYKPHIKTKIPTKILDKPFPLTRLSLDKFEGIQDGIEIFDGEKNPRF